MHTNFGVHIWGFCIDPQGEASFAFGATEEFKIVREQEKLSLNSTIKDWETKFRCALFIYLKLFIVLTRPQVPYAEREGSSRCLPRDPARPDGSERQREQPRPFPSGVRLYYARSSL